MIAANVTCWYLLDRLMLDKTSIRCVAQDFVTTIVISETGYEKLKFSAEGAKAVFPSYHLYCKNNFKHSHINVEPNIKINLMMCTRTVREINSSILSSQLVSLVDYLNKCLNHNKVCNQRESLHLFNFVHLPKNHNIRYNLQRLDPPASCDEELLWSFLRVSPNNALRNLLLAPSARRQVTEILMPTTCVFDQTQNTEKG